MSDTKSYSLPTPEQMLQLSPEEKAAVAAMFLGELEPGRQPFALFQQMARLTCLSTVEIVPVRQSPRSGETEALLLQRPSSDNWWPNKWHIPGTIILPTDEVPHDKDIDFEDPEFDPIASYSGPLSRLLRDELKDGVEFTDGPHLLESRFRRGVRSSESTVMLWAEVNASEEGGLPVGQFFEAPNISVRPPESGLVVGHAGLIERTAAAYAQHLAQ